MSVPVLRWEDVKNWVIGLLLRALCEAAARVKSNGSTFFTMAQSKQLGLSKPFCERKVLFTSL